MRPGTLAALLEWSDPKGFDKRAKAVRGFTDAGALVVLERVVKSGTKLPDVTPHDLRHTFATLALRKGIPVEVVSKTLGR